MSDPIERAKQDLASLDDQIRRAEARKVEIETFLRMYEHYASGAEVPRVSGGGAKVSNQEIADTAERALEARGEPQKLQPLSEALEAAGVCIPGNNKLARLSQVLSRDERFYSAGKHVGWWLNRMATPTPSPATSSESHGGAEYPASAPDGTAEDHKGNTADVPKTSAAQLFERPA